LLNGAGYRTIVVEPLGIGSSARPQRADYSLTAQADRIAGVLDSLGIRQAFVIAHSLGGAEGFRLAYRRPDLVRGLISLEGEPPAVSTRPSRRTWQWRTRASRRSCGPTSATSAARSASSSVGRRTRET